MLGGPQSRSRHNEVEKNLNPCRESNPSRPACSLVTILTKLTSSSLKTGVGDFPLSIYVFMAWCLLDSERTLSILALPFAIIDYSEQIWLSSYKKSVCSLTSTQLHINACWSQPFTIPKLLNCNQWFIELSEKSIPLKKTKTKSTQPNNC
jgi:hypothetical protein